ncbi:uncharacterized protein [Primulina eburnea]|uniref:uncharacterized protein n=1 Tax=Primulina eburnea TaxID=1245227 RepID=UPI003C6BEA18
MNCFVWNARGLGNPRAFRELRRLVDKSNPSMMFICETKLYKSQYASWRSYIQFKGIFSVECEGRKGGLVMLWKDMYDIKICSFSSGHIDCIVSAEQKFWRFTGFSGNPIPELQQLPWLVGGDFNEIIFNSEKYGCSLRPQSQMTAFNDTINGCLFKQHNGEHIFERLDRFLGNAEWQMLFPLAEVTHLDFYSSDHRLISISMKMGCEAEFRKRPSRFTFEHKWMLEEDFQSVMDQWKNNVNFMELPSKLNQFSGILKSWAGSRFSDFPRKIELLRKEINELLTPSQAKNNSVRLVFLEHELEKLLIQEEMHWNQRARTNWMAHGDGNTKFFHSFASERKRSNLIKGLVDDSGRWWYKESDIADIFVK